MKPGAKGEHLWGHKGFLALALLFGHALGLLRLLCCLLALGLLLLRQKVLAALQLQIFLRMAAEPLSAPLSEQSNDLKTLEIACL